MSSTAAFLLVVGPLTLFGIPALWWIFHRMDRTSTPIALDEPPSPMSASDILRIEQALDVHLPSDYMAFVCGARDDGHIDRQSVFDSADDVIELTLSHRRADAGGEPWPPEYVYVGDEADASPYVLNCRTGEVIRAEKGKLRAPPIRRYPSFTSVVDGKQRSQ